MKRLVARALAVTLLLAGACGGDDEGDGTGQTGSGASGAGGSTGSDGVGGGVGGAVGSASCDKPTMLTCDEYQNASAALRAQLEETCMQFGGTFADPAACPMAAFVGKCALPENPDGSLTISRYYEGTDVDAQESSCTTIQGGTWDTTF
jgi:hypothetical protein